ncbi:MAG TPA: ABC transporter permease [Candidatus Paceibacterota bacterium]
MTGGELWVAYVTLVKKEVYRFLRVWAQTLLPPVITTSLYFLIFGTFIGSQIRPIDGYSYMQFIVPGLVMLTIIMSAFQNTVSSFFSSKFQRAIEELMVSPMPYGVIIAGFVTGALLRSIIVGTIVFGIALFFTNITILHFWVVVTFALLTAILFALAGLANGIFANTFDDISVFPTFVLTPLTYLGGIFYSVNALPPFWRMVSEWNPIFYMISGFRFGFLGVSDTSLVLSFFVLVTLTALLVTLNWWLFKTGRGLRS